MKQHHKGPNKGLCARGTSIQTLMWMKRKGKEQPSQQRLSDYTGPSGSRRVTREDTAPEGPTVLLH